MAKIYETLDDLHRDALTKKARASKKNASDDATGTLWGAITAFLAFDRHAVAKQFPQSMGEPLFKSKAGKWLHEKTFLVMGITASVCTVASGVLYFLAKKSEKNAEQELRQLGVEQEIIRLPDGGEIRLPDDKEIMSAYFKAKNTGTQSHQASTLIQSDTAQVGRLQAAILEKNKSL